MKGSFSLLDFFLELIEIKLTGKSDVYRKDGKKILKRLTFEYLLNKIIIPAY